MSGALLQPGASVLHLDRSVPHACEMLASHPRTSIPPCWQSGFEKEREHPGGHLWGALCFAPSSSMFSPAGSCLRTREPGLGETVARRRPSSVGIPAGSLQSRNSAATCFHRGA